MNSTNLLTKCLGYSLIGTLYLLLFTLLICIFSIYRLYNNDVLLYQPFLSFQKYFYKEYYRNIWQYSENCIETDELLMYRPKLGVCTFSNLEFSTTLNFDKYGRAHEGRDLQKMYHKSNGIAVIGDSFSMGWGVNDSQTFSYLLQRKTGRPVYNLAVSSYATEREIQRLIQSDLLSQIDTIIIQYCENDLNENKFFDNKDRFLIEQEKYNHTLNTYRLRDSNKENNVIYLTPESLLRLSSKVTSYLFSDRVRIERDHIYYFEKIIQKYKAYLDNKKIIVFYANEYKNFFDNWENNSKNSIIHIDYQKKLSLNDYYPLDGHLNNSGHSKLSNLIYESLNTD